jgi:hypothetical protein
VLAACSPVDDLIPGPSGIGSDTDALLAARLAAGDHRALTEVLDRLGYHAGAQDVVPHERVVASEAVLAPQLLESS